MHNVSSDWVYGPLDGESLGLLIPKDQNIRTVSKELFVRLLEFCEDDLQVERVVAVFNKKASEGVPDQMDPFAITLRYIGFRPISPDKFPSTLNPDEHFAMQYTV